MGDKNNTPGGFSPEEPTKLGYAGEVTCDLETSLVENGEILSLNVTLGPDHEKDDPGDPSYDPEVHNNVFLEEPVENPKM